METTSHLVSDQISIPIGEKNLLITVGPFAGLAGQSLFCQYGDTKLLVCTTMSKTVREGLDFFPLVVNYEEKMYAAGKIPGGFIKKEGRPSDSSILTSRAIDRPIRPLFPDGMRNEVQCVILTLCADQENPPDIPATIGTSAALLLSDIPFEVPMAAVRVAMKDGELVVLPTFEIMEDSPLDLTVCATRDRVMMLEAGGKEISEETMVEAIEFGMEHIRTIIDAVEELRSRIGKEKREPTFVAQPSEEFAGFVSDHVDEAWPSIIGLTEKKARDSVMDELTEKIIVDRFGEDKDEWAPEELIEKKQIGGLIEKGVKKLMRARILDEGLRIDDRKTDQIRPIWSEVAIIPRTHGSAMFTRGETQAMSITTLGAIGDKQRLDDIGVVEEKRYMHHYYAAPYCYGDTGFMRGPGRREIGHGALAEKALSGQIPEDEVFPYTIRLVTEIMSSNGSTSMASVCGSTLSLMDAGVPLKEPVAGIAMGLITDPDSDRFVVLTDLMGIEDFYGDMDFKVAGTKNGITAVQMDTKIHGLTIEMIKQIFADAKVGRLNILGQLLETIPEPRPELSEYAPRITTVVIDPEKIGDLIGPGGKTVRGIIEETGVEIDINDDGKVFVTSTDGPAMEAAIQMITEIVHDPEVGEIYEGKVVKLASFGAFVKLTQAKDGLLHISQICDRRVEEVEDCLKVGDVIKVMVKEVDSDSRKISLTRKGLEFPDGDPILERLKNIPDRPPRRDSRSGGGYDRGGRDSRSGGRDSRSRDSRGGGRDRGGRDRGGRDR